MSYKILTLGGRGPLCQQDRVDDGFKLLGHELVQESPNFIYCNDYNHHAKGIELKKKYPNSKLILNTLDLPSHVKEYGDILDQLSINFYQADAFTTISETVKEQMLSKFPHIQKKGVDVIYQPIKNVKPLNLKRNSNLMILGRVLDANKRAILSIYATKLSSLVLDVYGTDNIDLVLEQEYKKIVKYGGLLTDKQLNIEYNSHAAVLITSQNEGLCLPLVEAICSKTPVVCCSDMTTSHEFCPPEFICEPTPFSIYDKIKYVTSGDIKIQKILDEYSEKYLKQFSPESVAYNIVKSYEKTL